MFKTIKVQSYKTNVISWKLCLFIVIITVTNLTSCTNDYEEEPVLKPQKEISITSIPCTGITRADGGSYLEAYRCTSETSSLVSNIYIDSTYNKAWINMLNSTNEVAYSLEICIDSSTKDKDAYRYTAYNEMGEPIMGGIYNCKSSAFSIDKVYGNDLVTRASAASWGCNLGLMAAGLAWSIPAGMVSMGASVLISVAYTAAAIQICDGL